MDLLQKQHFDTKLFNLIKDIDLQQLSRVPSSRLKESALPNIGTIELVSADAFQEAYNELYLSMFHGGERERSDLIVTRLQDEFANRRAGLAPYRIVGIRAPNGEAIGAAQFSVLMLRGGKYAVPYVQYIYIRLQNRRQDMSEVLHTMVLAVATADARATGEARLVPFTLFETEPPGHGVSQSSQANATERITIHTRSGSQAMMLRTKGDGAETENRIYSAHVQPGLEPEEGPITLIWAIRPSPIPDIDYDIDEVGPALTAAYYRSLRDEGFPEQNIALAERMAANRRKGAQFVLVPLANVTAAMYQNLPDSEGA